MEPIKRVRLSESLVEVLKRIIADEGLAPGDKFHSENELASRLGVSRSSIREAVRILEVLGRLSVRQGKGIFIAGTEDQSFAAFADWVRDNDQSLQEHFEVRLIVEPQTARLAALNATPEEVAALAAVHADFVRNAGLGLTAETILCDRAFHKLLGRTTHNKFLAALIRSITTSLLDDWISSFHTPGRMEKTVGEHGRILAAVEAGNPEAAMESMAAHLRNAIRDITTNSRD